MNDFDDSRSAQISRLVDGQLPSDQANRLLDELLDDPQLQQTLREHLQLNRTLSPWREATDWRSASIAPVPVPQSPPLVAPPAQREGWGGHSPAWGLSGALVGALLVLAGVFVAHSLQRQAPVEMAARTVPVQQAPRNVTFITPERRKEVEDVFTMYESIAGPLAWMADSPEEIQVHETREALPQASVGVLLQIRRHGNGEQSAREYAIVCRSGAPATFEVPYGRRPVRLHVVPRCNEQGGDIRFQYALSIPGSDEGEPTAAVLTGQQHLGLQPAPLGQLVVDDQLLDLRAGAWTF